MVDGPYTYEEAAALAKDFVCGECGANLLNPWGGYLKIEGYIIRCYKNPSHQGIKKPGRETRWFYDLQKGWLEYDIMTQRQVNPGPEAGALALPDSEVGMMDRLRQAVNIGLFPEKNVSPEQLANLAKLALLYKLDPLMQEIMPYQNQPYITLVGRRRIDARAGNFPSIRYRPMDRETREMYAEMGAISMDDIVILATLTDPKTGQQVETIGRVQASESAGGGNRSHLPIVKWRLEMAFKRAEARGRKTMYGPVALPYGMESRLIEDGDDVIEGTYQFVPSDEAIQGEQEPDGTPPEPAQPTGSQARRSQSNRSAKADNCPVHNKPWAKMPDGRIGHPTGDADSFAPCYKDEAPAADSPVTEPPTDLETPAEPEVGGDEAVDMETENQWDALLQEIDNAGMTTEKILGGPLDSFFTMGGTLELARERFEKAKRV